MTHTNFKLAIADVVYVQCPNCNKIFDGKEWLFNPLAVLNDPRAMLAFERCEMCKPAPLPAYVKN